MREFWHLKTYTYPSNDVTIICIYFQSLPSHSKSIWTFTICDLDISSQIPASVCVCSFENTCDKRALWPFRDQPWNIEM